MIIIIIMLYMCVYLCIYVYSCVCRYVCISMACEGFFAEKTKKKLFVICIL